MLVLATAGIMLHSPENANIQQPLSPFVPDHRPGVESLKKDQRYKFDMNYFGFARAMCESFTQKFRQEFEWLKS